MVRKHQVKVKGFKLDFPTQVNPIKFLICHYKQLLRESCRRKGSCYKGPSTTILFIQLHEIFDEVLNDKDQKKTCQKVQIPHEKKLLERTLLPFQTSQVDSTSKSLMNKKTSVYCKQIVFFMHVVVNLHSYNGLISIKKETNTNVN